MSVSLNVSNNAVTLSEVVTDGFSLMILILVTLITLYLIIKFVTSISFDDDNDLKNMEFEDFIAKKTSLLNTIFEDINETKEKPIKNIHKKRVDSFEEKMKKRGVKKW